MKTQLLVVFLLGCGAAALPLPPKIIYKPVEKVVLVPERIPCATEPPPRSEPESEPAYCEADKPCLSKCPLGYICLKLVDAINHLEADERMLRWSGVTWGLCAPPTTQPASLPTGDTP